MHTKSKLGYSGNIVTLVDLNFGASSNNYSTPTIQSSEKILWKHLLFEGAVFLLGYFGIIFDFMKFKNTFLCC